jgi:hypothetical protein
MRGMRVKYCLFVPFCLTILSAGYPASSSASAQPDKYKCHAEAIATCLVQLGKSMHRDVEHDKEAQHLCRKYMAPCVGLKVTGITNTAPIAVVDAPAAPPHREEIFGGGQSIYLRADPYDNPFPGLTRSAPAGQALGASFAYTWNDFVQSNVKVGTQETTVVSQSSSITATGMVTYLLAQRNDISNDLAWLPALWVFGNGNWDNPTKAFGDTSAVKVGPKAEFLLYPIGESQWSSYFEVAPFYQTDFYGKAEAGGVSFDWMPFNRNFFLGGMPDGFRPTLLAGFLELVGEATDVSVVQPGQTNLVAHDYEWLGGVARVYLFPFPSQSATASDPIANRLSLIGTVQSYWDANSRSGTNTKSATLYSVALQYKLACDTKMTTVCPFGAPSLSLQYDNGTDKDMLQEKKLLKLMLTYAF